jgi:hypothetical protein
MSLLYLGNNPTFNLLERTLFLNTLCCVADELGPGYWIALHRQPRLERQKGADAFLAKQTEPKWAQDIT